MPRESELKRHHSRFDRESSPKRSRRDGKPTKERTPNRLNPERRERDDDRKHRRRPHDPLPLEKPHPSDSKLTERSNTGHNGTSTVHGGRSERGRSRDHEDDRRGRHRISDAVDKNEKPAARGDDTRGQRQEEPSKTKAEQPTKKKFREEKLLPTERAAEEVKNEDVLAERGNRGYAGRNEHYDRAKAGNRLQLNRACPERGGFPSRERFRGGEGYGRRHGYGGGGGGADKWKHDMFDEVNRSPTSKNEEEDPVAKVEALLAL